MIPALKDKVIAVICGGLSEESAVSLRSGKNVVEALQRLGYKTIQIDPAKTDVLSQKFDVAFIALHGPHGEDGSIQTLLETYGIPYTGSRANACMLAMNKVLTKSILVKEGLPTAKYQVITQNPESQTLKLELPVLIKPVAMGSSVGVEICHTPEEYVVHAKQLVAAFQYCLVEDLISGKEVTVGVIERNQKAEVLPVLELRPKTDFYDYHAKYTPNMTEFIIPASLSEAQTQEVQSLALKLHHLLGCRGMSRIDMMVDPIKGPIILELNAIPGLTDLSDLPAQAKAAGISFDELVEIILESAL